MFIYNGLYSALLHFLQSFQKTEPESTRKLTNFNFQWAKTLYQNNLNITLLLLLL